MEKHIITANEGCAFACVKYIALYRIVNVRVASFKPNFILDYSMIVKT